MKFLLFLVLFIFLYPFIAKLISRLVGYLFVRHIEKKTRQMEDDFARAAGLDPEEMRRQRRHEAETAKKGGWSAPIPREKKIDPQMGEYVNFKEVVIENVEETTTAYTSESSAGKGQFSSRTTVDKTIVEEQITDVKWEDVE